MTRFASLQGKSVKIIRYESALGRGESIPVGLRGKVVWDEGGDEVVVAFSQEVSNGGFATDQLNQAWMFRSWLEQVTEKEKGMAHQNDLILVARVTVGDETLIVKADEITGALTHLNGEPKAGMLLEATIEFDAMTPTEFDAVPEHQ